MKGYNSPLISVDWLSDNLNDPNLVILNATLPKLTESAKETATKHIKGARYFDIKNVFSDTNSQLPNTFPPERQFESEAQKLGITTDSFIVVYDDHGIYSSPRVWWLFIAFGHKNIAVLDGGLPAWLAAEKPVETPQPYAGALGNFKAKYQKGKIKNYKEVLSILNTDGIKILDARSGERFRGSVPEPRKGLRSGHIPSSKNLPYTDLLVDGRLLSKDSLTEKFKYYQDKELVFSCGSGITACILALGAEVAGHKNISVYDGSWTEWGSRHELPVGIER